MPSFNALIEKGNWSDILMEWRHQLEVDGKASVISQNLNREAHLNQSFHADLMKFLNRLGSYLENHGLKETPQSLIPILTDEPPSIHLGGGEISYSGSLSRIMSFEDVKMYLSGGKGQDQDDDFSILRDAIKDGIFIPIGILETSRPFCWVTTTEFIDDLRGKSSSSDLADQVRDNVGLYTLNRMELAEIVYPSDSDITLKRPTVLDAGVSPVFRPCEDKGEFGRTVHLKTLECAGFEAVHGKSTAGNGFSARLIGSPRSPVRIDFKKLYEFNAPGENPC